MRLAITALLVVWCVSNAGAEALFSDDFEGDLSGWEQNAHGVIVDDPISPGNRVLTFTANDNTWDLLSPELPISPDSQYVISFDYLGIPTDQPHPDNLGGVLDFRDFNLPYDTNYDWGTTLCDGFDAELIDDGQWHHYSLVFSPYDFYVSPLSSIRISVEDWDGAAGQCPPDMIAGDAFFDNIELATVTVTCIGLWRFEEGIAGQSAIGESTILDSSGYQSHGTPSGLPVYERDTAALSALDDTLSLSFDGNDDRVVFNSVFPFHQAGDATIELWIKHDRSTPQSDFLWTRSDQTDANRYNFALYDNGNFAFDYRSPSGALHEIIGGFGAGVPIPQDTWVHLAVTRENNVYTVYVNGEERASATDSAPDLPNAAGWTISGRNGYSFSGSIDAIRFSPGVLSPDEFVISVNQGVEFTNIADGALLQSTHTTGVSLFDSDADGDLDIFLANSWDEANQCLLNDGSGAFTSVVDNDLDSQTWNAAVAVANADDDSLPDVLLTGWNGTPQLLRNDGGGQFSDLTPPEIAGLSQSAVKGATWFNLDNNRYPDIYLMVNNAPGLVLANRGNFEFDEVGGGHAAQAGSAMEVVAGDVDDDGDQDLYIVYYGGNNHLLINRGDGTFEDNTPPELAGNGAGQSASFVDFDNDGDLDLYVVNFGVANRMFENNGAGGFSEYADAELQNTSNGQSGVWGDYDLDGDLDLFINNFEGPNCLLRNDGVEGFTNVTPSDMADETLQSLGAAWGDVDGDGDLDLLVGNHGAPKRLWRNDLDNGNHWLQVRLRGVDSERVGLGVKIDCYSGDLVQHREIGSSKGMFSQDPAWATFGLGHRMTVDSLVVRWPDGTVQVVNNPPVDAPLTILEEVVPPEPPMEVLFFDDFEDGFDPSWIQPHGGWAWEDGHIYNTTTCGYQQCMPDIWAGGPEYADYTVSFDLKLSGGDVNIYVMANDPAEAEEGQTGAYNIDTGIGDGLCGGKIWRIGPGQTGTLLASRSDAEFCFNPTVIYRIKWGRIGQQLLYKKWPAELPEPGEWLLEATDDIFHTGYWGISFWNGYGIVDNFLVEGIAPFHVSVEDRPADQGGILEASWSRHWSDSSSAANPITAYDVQKDGQAWVTVATVAAAEADSYAVQFATPDVFVVGQPEPFSTYRVVARTADPATFFVSEVDSGYSVDNLAPPQPVVQLLEYGDIVVVTWQAPDIPDLEDACVYRSTTPNVIPGDLLECTTAPAYVDALNVMVYYRVQFSDIHGNLSEFSEVVSPTSTGVPDGQVPAKLALFPPYPNPFNPRTTVSFALPATGHATLAIYDAKGQMVTRLVDEVLPAGAHHVDWLGTDTAGRQVPSGTYFCRLETQWGVETAKLSLLR